jgi:hypothetical protein
LFTTRSATLGTRASSSRQVGPAGCLFQFTYRPVRTLSLRIDAFEQILDVQHEHAGKDSGLSGAIGMRLPVLLAVDLHGHQDRREDDGKRRASDGATATPWSGVSASA